MPIASGASGRVDVGVDTSKRWAPEGLRGRLAFHQYDSYLQQYQELKQIQNKKNTLLSSKDGTDPGDHRNNGAEKQQTEKNEGSKDSTSRRASRGKESKLCVIF